MLYPGAENPFDSFAVYSENRNSRCRNAGKSRKITSLAFGQRRKMLRQSLKAMPGLLDKCRDLGIEPTARAEELPPEAFLRLAEN